MSDLSPENMSENSLNDAVKASGPHPDTTQDIYTDSQDLKAGNLEAENLEAQDTSSYQAEIDLHDSAYYFNRELSWLKFNERVLEEAEDIENPLLERLKFLAIFSANLDEFMMIRYAGIKEQVGAGITKLTADGRTPAEQSVEIPRRLRPLLERQGRHLNHVILPALDSYGVKIEQTASLNEEDANFVDAYFRETLFPVLTPLALDSGNPFPRLPFQF